MARTTLQGYTVSGIWIDLREYPGYAVSDDGRVMNTTTGLIKNQSINQQRIAMVNMSINGQQHVRSIAVMVANSFLDRSEFPEHFDTPIHLDGDKRNCRADNLTWRPRWFAVKYHRQFSEWERENRFGFRQPIEIIETGEVFENSLHAAVTYGLLDREIFLAMANRTFVFPHNFTFREVDT